MQPPRQYFTRTPSLGGSVVSIGAFDGVHRGHQALLGVLVGRARELGVPAVVYTFDPPPRTVLCGAPRLSSSTQQVERLRQCGVDIVVKASFDEAYRSREPTEFIAELQRLKPLAVHVGEDFRFGRNRAGNVQMLRQSFQVELLPAVRCDEGEVISSTRVRKLLAAGEYAEAQTLLGWT